MNNLLFIWDFDGTILNTEQIYKESRKQLLESLQCNRNIITYIDQFRFSNELDFIQFTSHLHQKDVEMITNEYQEILVNNSIKFAKDDYGFATYIRNIKYKSTHHLFTNAYASVVSSCLTKLNCNDIFDKLTCLDDQLKTQIFKPASYPFLSETKGYHVIVVGDSVVDLELSVNVGARECLLLNKHHQKIQEKVVLAKFGSTNIRFIPADYEDFISALNQVLEV